LSLLVPLAACGGRADLTDTHGAAYRRVMSAQAQARPRKSPVGFNASDVRIVVANRRAVSSKPGAGIIGSSTATSASGGGGGGAPTSVTVDLGAEGASEMESGDTGGSGRNRRPIVLQAK
jgi:hypothetical protein